MFVRLSSSFSEFFWKNMWFSRAPKKRERWLYTFCSKQRYWSVIYEMTHFLRTMKRTVISKWLQIVSWTHSFRSISKKFVEWSYLNFKTFGEAFVRILWAVFSLHGLNSLPGAATTLVNNCSVSTELLQKSTNRRDTSFLLSVYAPLGE